MWPQKLLFPICGLLPSGHHISLFLNKYVPGIVNLIFSTFTQISEIKRILGSQCVSRNLNIPFDELTTQDGQKC